MSFFLIFKDRSKDQSVATKWANKAKRAFEGPAVSEALARSGLDWLPTETKKRNSLIRQLFAAACGRSDYASLSVTEPPDGAVSSSLYDEKCPPKELSERRRLQAAAVLKVLQRHWAHRTERNLAPHEAADSSPPTLKQCEQLLAAWQPTAKNHSLDASIRPLWFEVSPMVSRLRNAVRAGHSISLSPAVQQLLHASIRRATEAPTSPVEQFGAELFRCAVRELAFALLKEADEHRSSAIFGFNLLEDLSSHDDPYACIRMATILVEATWLEKIRNAPFLWRRR